MSATILRIKRRPAGFTQVDNHTLRDPDISFRATGLLAVLLSMPEGSKIDSPTLAGMKSEGREAIRSALRELEEAGYLRRTKEQADGGQWRTVTEVAEARDLLHPPETGFRASGDGEPKTGSRASVSRALIHSGDNKSNTPPDPHGGADAVDEVKAQRDADVNAVFEAWKESTGHPRAVLDKARRKKIEDRLKDYTVAELIVAVRGIARSAFHMGENDGHKKYDDITLILRDSAHVEQFANLELQARRRSEKLGGKDTWMDRSRPIEELT